MSDPDAEITTEFEDIPGQFKVTHTYNKANGYSQVCVTLRDDGAPIVIIDGVNGDVHVGVYDKDTETRIHRNGKPL